MMKPQPNFVRRAVCYIANLLGLLYLWQMIRPPINRETGRRPPVTLIYWMALVTFILFSSYVSLFAIASSRYTRNIALIESRINSIYGQLSTQKCRLAFGRIGPTQRMLRPLKPEFKKPVSMLRSFYVERRYEPGIQQLQKALIFYRDSLSRADLQYANFNALDFSDVNFEGSNLSFADLRFTNLRRANIEGTLFEGADIEGADFTDAIGLEKDHFKRAYYRKVKPTLPAGIDLPPVKGE